MNCIKLYCLFAICVLSSNLKAQIFYYVNSVGEIYTYDISTCQSEFVVAIEGAPISISDITFAPDGNLYGLQNGKIVKIDLNTGGLTLVLDCNCLANSLTSDGSGNLYFGLTGLYIFNIYTQNFIYAGGFPNNIIGAGDFTFRGDSLFLAGVNNDIILIDEFDPNNSSVLFNYTDSISLFGISTFFINCDSLVSFGSGNNGNIYLIDFSSQEIIDIGCSPGTAVFGLATPDEWQASDCTFRIDLDGDDSSDYLGQASADGYWRTVCSTPVAVVDTDVVIEAGPQIDSITLRLDGADVLNGMLEYLSAQALPNVGVAGSGTGQLTLFSLGANAQDFEWALQGVSYHNDAPLPDPGLRHIEVTMWAQAEALSRSAVAAIELLYPGPLTFSLGNDTLLCPGQTLQLSIPYDYYHQVINGTDTLTFGTYTWQDGSTGQDFVLDAAGVYSASFSYEQAFGCTWSDTIEVAAGDTVLTQSQAILCEGQSYTIGNVQLSSDTILCITYQAVDGCDSTHCTQVVFLPVSDPTLIDTTICQGNFVQIGGVQYSQPGNYTDTLQNWNGCDSVVMLSLQVLEADTTVVGLSVCEGETVEIGGQSFGQSGNYEVMLTNQQGCDSVVQLSLMVTQPDTTWLAQTICDGDSVEVGGQTFSTSGSYSILLTNQWGCDSTVFLQLSVIPPVVIEIDTAVCEGDAVAFMGQLIEVGGTYTHTLPGQPPGCDTTYVLNLTVWPLPQLTLESTGNSCLGEQITLTATTDAMDLLWSTGETTSSIVAAQSGQYTVTVTDGHGCIASSSVGVDYTGQLTVELSWASPVCPGAADGFIAIDSIAGGLAPYTIFVNGIAASVSGQYHDLPAGSYEVLLTDAQGCQWVQTVVLAEPPPFVVDAGPDRTIRLGEEVLLEASVSQPVDSLWWWPADAVSCAGCPETTALPTASTTYQVYAINAVGCLASDEVRVVVDGRTAVYAPNAFSPNGDGINDTFTLYAGKGVASVEYLAVFDRWGGMVYEEETLLPNDPAAGWDGSWRDRPAAAGVYVWLARLRLIDGRTVLEKGEVTLMR